MKMRIGLIGTGKRARVYRRPIRYLMNEGVLELVGVANKSNASQSEVESLFGAPLIPIAHLIERSDALLICVPSKVTLPLLFEVLSKGKHAFVETPIIATEAELLEVAHLMREKNCTVEYAHNLAESPEIQFLVTQQNQLGLGPIRTFGNHGRVTDYHALAIASVFPPFRESLLSRPVASAKSDAFFGTQALHFSNGAKYVSVSQRQATKPASRKFFKFSFDEYVVYSDQDAKDPNETRTALFLTRLGEEVQSIGEARLQEIHLVNEEGRKLATTAIPGELAKFTNHEIGLVFQLRKFCRAITTGDASQCSIGFHTAAQVSRALKRMVLANQISPALGRLLGDYWIDFVLRFKLRVLELLGRK